MDPQENEEKLTNDEDAALPAESATEQSEEMQISQKLYFPLKEEEDGPHTRAIAMVLSTLFKLEFVESKEEAQIVLTSQVDESLRYLDEGYAVIHLTSKNPTMGFSPPAEGAIRHPEFSKRYRTADILQFIPGMVRALADFKQLTEAPAAAPSAAELGLPESLPVSQIENKKILVLDDSALNRSSAQFQFGAANELEVVETYQAAAHALQQQSYDIVALDLLMPPESFTLSQQAYARVAGTEFPAGGIMSLIAANSGSTYVVVITDASHHDHPATALLDFLWDRPLQFVNGSTLVFKQAGVRRIEESGEYVKDWAASLDSLICGSE